MSVNWATLLALRVPVLKSGDVITTARENRYKSRSASSVDRAIAAIGAAAPEVWIHNQSDFVDQNLVVLIGRQHPRF
jgi:hypothetical protein